MPTPDIVLQQRIINGVNRLEDARIGDPGSWWATINLYGRQPTLLAKRPGSKLIVRGKGPLAAAEETATQNIWKPEWAWQNAAQLGPGEVDLATQGQSNLVPVGTLANMWNTVAGGASVAGIVAIGTRKLRPQMNPVSLSTAQLPSGTVDQGGTPIDFSAGVTVGTVSRLQVDVQRVAGLQRLYFDQTVRWLVGAYNFEGGLPDQLFYVNDDDVYLLPSSNGANETVISSSGADFFFVPYRTKVADASVADPKVGYWAIGTNQANSPFVIKLGSTTLGDEVRCAPMCVRKSNDSVSTGQKLYAIQAICVWQGAVVYGGFRMMDNAGANEERFDHMICFSQPGEAHLIARDSNVISSVRVGDSEQEPITAMITTAVPTDSVGIRSQLCVFTGKRVTIFDGLPPVDENPLGVNFSSSIMGVVGCNAPRTVVTTPHGVVFLGSDGVVYLLKGLDGLVPIGSAVKAVFASMTPRQQKQCAAVWDPEGFYKLSYPDVRPSGSVKQYSGLLDWLRIASRADADVPDRQFWADMRGLGQPAIDIGVKWYGPMVGMKHSCMTVASGAQDRVEIYAGSAIDGSIYQVALSDYVTDPNPQNPSVSDLWRPSTVYAAGTDAHQTASALRRWRVTTAGTSAATEPSWPASPTVDVTTQTDGTVTWTYKGTTGLNLIECGAATGLYDLGDAHVDKLVTALSFGFGTDRTTTVVSGIIVNQDNAAIAAQEEFTRVVTPSGALLNSTFVLNSSVPTSGDVFELVTERPGSRLRGKTFRFTFYETPAAGAKVFFSDLSFRAILATRRI